MPSYLPSRAGGDVALALPGWQADTANRLKLRALRCCCTLLFARRLANGFPTGVLQIETEISPLLRLGERTVACTVLKCDALQAWIPTSHSSSHIEILRPQRQAIP